MIKSEYCLIALMVVGLAVTGCATHPPVPEPMPDNRADLPMTRSNTTTSGPPVTQPVRMPYEDPTHPLYNRNIYFEYDRTEVAQKYIPLLRTHAAYLGSQTTAKVTLEGHTDERGTREYNLALGDQRTEVVRQFLAAEGVKPSQMSKLSFGEEKPADPGHGEPSWRSNRRVEIVY